MPHKTMNEIKALCFCAMAGFYLVTSSALDSVLAPFYPLEAEARGVKPSQVFY